MLLIFSPPLSVFKCGSETATLQIKSLENQGCFGLSAALLQLLQVVLSSPRRLGAAAQRLALQLRALGSGCLPVCLQLSAARYPRNRNLISKMKLRTCRS